MDVYTFSPRISKRKKAGERTSYVKLLEKECKNLGSKYPFLTPNQIKKRAREICQKQLSPDVTPKIRRLSKSKPYVKTPEVTGNKINNSSQSVRRHNSRSFVPLQIIATSAIEKTSSILKRQKTGSEDQRRVSFLEEPEINYRSTDDGTSSQGTDKCSPHFISSSQTMCVVGVRQFNTPKQSTEASEAVRFCSQEFRTYSERKNMKPALSKTSDVKSRQDDHFDLLVNTKCTWSYKTEKIINFQEAEDFNHCDEKTCKTEEKQQKRQKNGFICSDNESVKCQRKVNSKRKSKSIRKNYFCEPHVVDVSESSDNEDEPEVVFQTRMSVHTVGKPITWNSEDDLESCSDIDVTFQDVRSKALEERECLCPENEVCNCNPCESAEVRETDGLEVKVKKEVICNELPINVASNRGFTRNDRWLIGKERNNASFNSDKSLVLQADGSNSWNLPSSAMNALEGNSELHIAYQRDWPLNHFFTVESNKGSYTDESTDRIDSSLSSVDQLKPKKAYRNKLQKKTKKRSKANKSKNPNKRNTRCHNNMNMDQVITSHNQNKGLAQNTENTLLSNFKMDESDVKYTEQTYFIESSSHPEIEFNNKNNNNNTENTLLSKFKMDESDVKYTEQTYFIESSSDPEIEFNKNNNNNTENTLLSNFKMDESDVKYTEQTYFIESSSDPEIEFNNRNLIIAKTQMNPVEYLETRNKGRLNKNRKMTSEEHKKTPRFYPIGENVMNYPSSGQQTQSLQYQLQQSSDIYDDTYTKTETIVKNLTRVMPDAGCYRRKSKEWQTFHSEPLEVPKYDSSNKKLTPLNEFRGASTTDFDLSKCLNHQTLRLMSVDEIMSDPLSSDDDAPVSDIHKKDIDPKKNSLIDDIISSMRNVFPYLCEAEASTEEGNLKIPEPYSLDKHIAKDNKEIISSPELDISDTLRSLHYPKRKRNKSFIGGKKKEKSHEERYTNKLNKKDSETPTMKAEELISTTENCWTTSRKYTGTTDYCNNSTYKKGSLSPQMVDMPLRKPMETWKEKCSITEHNAFNSSITMNNTLSVTRHDLRRVSDKCFNHSSKSESGKVAYSKFVSSDDGSTASSSPIKNVQNEALKQAKQSFDDLNHWNISPVDGEESYDEHEISKECQSDQSPHSDNSLLQNNDEMPLAKRLHEIKGREYLKSLIHQENSVNELSLSDTFDSENGIHTLRSSIYEQLDNIANHGVKSKKHSNVYEEKVHLSPCRIKMNIESDEKENLLYTSKLKEEEIDNEINLFTNDLAYLYPLGEKEIPPSSKQYMFICGDKHKKEYVDSSSFPEVQNIQSPIKIDSLKSKNVAKNSRKHKSVNNARNNKCLKTNKYIDFSLSGEVIKNKRAGINKRKQICRKSRPLFKNKVSKNDKKQRNKVTGNVGLPTDSTFNKFPSLINKSKKKSTAGNKRTSDSKSNFCSSPDKNQEISSPCKNFSEKETKNNQLDIQTCENDKKYPKVKGRKTATKYTEDILFNMNMSNHSSVTEVLLTGGNFEEPGVQLSGIFSKCKNNEYKDNCSMFTDTVPETKSTNLKSTILRNQGQSQFSNLTNDFENFLSSDIKMTPEEETLSNSEEESNQKVKLIQWLGNRNLKTEHVFSPRRAEKNVKKSEKSKVDIALKPIVSGYNSPVANIIETQTECEDNRIRSLPGKIKANSLKPKNEVEANLKNTENCLSTPLSGSLYCREKKILTPKRLHIGNQYLLLAESDDDDDDVFSISSPEDALLETNKIEVKQLSLSEEGRGLLCELFD